jgi:hypothetical protein
MVVEITSNGVSPVNTCVLPTSIDINGLGSVVAGSTTTYTYTINGGSNYTFGSWSIVGGTLGAATGNQVTVTWGSDTGVNEASLQYSVFCGANTRIGTLLVDIMTPLECKAYTYNGGASGGTLNYIQCDGTDATEVLVPAGQTNDFCALANNYTATGTITVDLIGNC